MYTYRELNPEKVTAMSYAEFVAFINQINTPAGGFSTVNSWIYNSGIDYRSLILDVGCSTGFSSREIAKKTSCAVIGIDLCEAAIRGATHLLSMEERPLAVRYDLGDICEAHYSPSMFSHIILGSSLGFVQDKVKAVQLLKNFLDKDGYILMAPFWFTAPPPSSIVDNFEKEIGFRPQTEWGRNEWLDLFDKDLVLVYENVHLLVQESDETIKEHCNCTLLRCESVQGTLSSELKEVCYERLFKIRKVINSMRPYQKYASWVFRKNNLGYALCKY
jgi:SAM-dependent methyltransferase